MKAIQIRNVPDRLHGALKARAALLGKSLSEYLLEELRRLASRPTPDELRERIRRRAPVEPRVPPATVLREERDRN